MDGAAKIKLGHSVTNNKPNSTSWNHIFKLERQYRCAYVEGTKTAVALLYCSLSTKESIAGWWIRCGWRYGGITEYRP